MTRAERRRRMERAKKRVKRLFVCWDKGNVALVGKLARTRVPCSCIYCNQGRFESKPPPQVRRADPAPRVWEANWEPTRYADWELWEGWGGS